MNDTMQDNIHRLEDHRGKFIAGERYRARITCVRDCGVSVRMPAGGGSAVVSTKCWGRGEARSRALAKLQKNGELDVVVKSYDGRTKTLSLLLSTDLARKSAYQPLAKGTTLLVDTANLVGKIGHEHVAARLSALAAALADCGYKALFFWEHRSFEWAWRNQADAEEVAALKAFSRRKDVSLVGEESDLAMLHAAGATADSVIVTQDRLRDYAEVYPDIVGTVRHRSFSCVELDGRLLLTIYGLKDAIELCACAEPVIEDSVDDCEIRTDEAMVLRGSALPVVTPSRWGILGVVDDCVARGAGHRALAILSRVARKHPKYYHEIADAFANGSYVCADARIAARYDRLADRCEKAVRQRSRRRQRRNAERRRGSLESWSRAA